MHDIDHTRQELEMGAEADHEHDGESFLGELFGEAEDEAEDEDEYEDEYEAEADGEYDGEDEADGEYDGEDEREYEDEYGESPLSEEEELELASELLEVSNEAELDHFAKRKLYPKALGRHRKAAKYRGKHRRPKYRGRHRKDAVKAHARARGFARSRHGKGFGSMFKRFAKKALPIAGSIVKAGLPVVGTVVGDALAGPVGGTLGGFAGDVVGDVVGDIFGFELEGLSPEERDLEVARQIVRLGATAARHAARAPRHVPPDLAARRAFAAAAKLYAPGLLRRRRHRRRHCRHCGGPHRHGAHYHVRRPDNARAVAGTTAPVVEADASPEAIQSESGHAASGPLGGARSGRWFRRGRHVVLTGL